MFHQPWQFRKQKLTCAYKKKILFFFNRSVCKINCNCIRANKSSVTDRRIYFGTAKTKRQKQNFANIANDWFLLFFLFTSIMIAKMNWLFLIFVAIVTWNKNEISIFTTNRNFNLARNVNFTNPLKSVKTDNLPSRYQIESIKCVSQRQRFFLFFVFWNWFTDGIVKCGLLKAIY